jgi:hypothetical protein
LGAAEEVGEGGEEVDTLGAAIHKMRDSTKNVWLGMLGGILVTLGASLFLGFALLLSFLHHMFIVGVRYPKAAFAIAIPITLMAVGGTLCVRALKNS